MVRTLRRSICGTPHTSLAAADGDVRGPDSGRPRPQQLRTARSLSYSGSPVPLAWTNSIAPGESSAVGHRAGDGAARAPPHSRLRWPSALWHTARPMRETVRVWAEAFETFLLAVILEERKGKRAALLRFLLLLLSKLFQVGINLRRLLYDVRIIRDYTIGVQVIAIGNLTWGGTGKTPVVEKFARELQNQGRTVAILSRGYRSKPPPLGKRLLNKVLLREDRTPPRVVPDAKYLL